MKLKLAHLGRHIEDSLKILWKFGTMLFLTDILPFALSPQKWVGNVDSVVETI